MTRAARQEPPPPQTEQRGLPEMSDVSGPAPPTRNDGVHQTLLTNTETHGDPAHGASPIDRRSQLLTNTEQMTTSQATATGGGAQGGPLRNSVPQPKKDKDKVEQLFYPRRFVRNNKSFSDHPEVPVQEWIL